MAEGILKKMLADTGHKDVQVLSAGIGTLDGYPATPPSEHGPEAQGRHFRAPFATANHQAVQRSRLIFRLGRQSLQFMRNFPNRLKLFAVKGFPLQELADKEHSG
jgi:protein-tyrosine-phosphatase